MLTRKNLLACVFTGAGLMTTIVAAQAGGMSGGMGGMRSVNIGSVSNRLGALNCKNFGGGQKLNVFSNNSITNNNNNNNNIINSMFRCRKACRHIPLRGQQNQKMSSKTTSLTRITC